MNPLSRFPRLNSAWMDVKHRVSHWRARRQRSFEREATVGDLRNVLVVVVDSLRADHVSAFGHDREALLGEPATALIAEQTATRFRAVIEDLWTGEDDTRTIEVTLTDADGNRHRCEVSVSLLPTGEDGAFRGTVGVIHDVTASHRRKQAIAMSDRVLRHNFRNNLNVVRGHATELEEEADADIAERAATIRREADLLLSLGENARYLYEVLRTEPDDISTVDLVSAVESAVASVGEHFPAARIERTLPEQAPVRAHHVIEQAVAELVESAIAEAADESPTVRVSVTTGTTVELRVGVDGGGFADGVLRRGRLRRAALRREHLRRDRRLTALEGRSPFFDCVRRNAPGDLRRDQVTRRRAVVCFALHTRNTLDERRPKEVRRSLCSKRILKQMTHVRFDDGIRYRIRRDRCGPRRPRPGRVRDGVQTRDGLREGR